MSQENELKAKEKLQWLGLSSAAQSLSEVQKEINNLEKNLASYSEFVDHLENGYDLDGDGDKEAIDSFTDFKTYLQDQGFTSSEADQFIEKIKNNFTDDDSDGTVFDEFKNYITTQTAEWEDLKSGFGNTTSMTSEVENEDGEPAAGIVFHEQGGTTKEGVSIPAGTTEIYGREVHFSQGTPADDEDANDIGSITFDNIRAETNDAENIVTIEDKVPIKADITNSKTTGTNVVTPIIEDGSQMEDSEVENGPASQDVYVPANSTQTVKFVVKYDRTQAHDYQIRTSGEVTVTWVNPGL